MKSTFQALNNRGYSDEQLENRLRNEPTTNLINLLESPDPQERTSAANILGRRKEKNAIIPLCNALTKEKALYSRIAISEALGEIGVDALPFLIKWLGKIGKNQHKSLPNKAFNKTNYPLPRDIVARTIIKMGKPALPTLEKVLLNDDRSKIPEAVDAIGYIAFYTHELRSLGCLFKCLEKHHEDEVIVWKIVRAFEAYPLREVKEYLMRIKNDSENQALVWEAERSLRQIDATERSI